MGMNYYIQQPATNHCVCCGRKDEGERLHIGKSSGGWCFSLHVIPEQGIHDLDDWLPLLNSGDIINEYNEPVSRDELLRVITERKWRDQRWNGEWFGYRDEAHFHASNHSERGPKGLLRHQVGEYCMKHGTGTWDCIEGNFS